MRRQRKACVKVPWECKVYRYLKLGDFKAYRYLQLLIEQGSM